MSENGNDKKWIDSLIKFSAVVVALVPLYLGVNSYKIAQENIRWEQLQQFLANIQEDKPNKNAYVFILSLLTSEHPKLAENALIKMLRNSTNKIEDKAEIIRAISEIEDHTRIRICNMDFSGINLSGIQLNNFEFIKCKFDNTMLEYTQFININFDSSSFCGAYLANAIFDKVELSKTIFYSSKLNNTHFVDVNSFEDADFSISFWGYAKIDDQGFKKYLNEKYADIKDKGNN